jgi:hypothetical protein
MNHPVPHPIQKATEDLARAGQQTAAAIRAFTACAQNLPDLQPQVSRKRIDELEEMFRKS